MLRSILGIVLIVFSCWVTLLATGWTLPYEYTLKLIKGLQNNIFQSLAFALCILFIGLYLLRMEPSKRNITNTCSTMTASGELRITKGAIEDIILHSISDIISLRGVKTNIKKEADGLEIIITCQLNDDANFPGVSLKIQDTVRQRVEQYSGIKVKEVKVLVQSFNFERRPASKNE